MKFTPDGCTPKHLAERIINSKAALEDERKQVTVLFADLKRSMRLLADRYPEEARKILDPVLELMMDAVHHLRRGDLPRATGVVQRSLDLCQTWQFTDRTLDAAATLGAAYALAGRTDEALPMVAAAVEEFRGRQFHVRPGLILPCAGTTYLSAGRIDEAASHAREALPLTRRLRARGGRGPRPLPRR